MVDHLAVDVQHQRGHRASAYGPSAGPHGRGEAVVAEGADAVEPRGVLRVELGEGLVGGAGVVARSRSRRAGRRSGRRCASRDADDDVAEPPGDRGDRRRVGLGEGEVDGEVAAAGLDGGAAVPRGRTLQQPGTGSQKYSSSVSPSRRAGAGASSASRAGRRSSGFQLQGVSSWSCDQPDAESGQDRSAIVARLRCDRWRDHRAGAAAARRCSSSGRCGPGRSSPSGSASRPRSVRRDVERLRALGYPVHASQGVGGGYQLGAGTGPAAAAARRRGGDRHRGLPAARRGRHGRRRRRGRAAGAGQARPGAAGAAARRGAGAARRDRDAGGSGGSRSTPTRWSRWPGPAATPCGCGSRTPGRGRRRAGAPGRALPAGRHRPALVPAGLRPRPRRLAHRSGWTG